MSYFVFHGYPSQNLLLTQPDQHPNPNHHKFL
jgi:hypothetical protein